MFFWITQLVDVIYVVLIKWECNNWTFI